jgi:hypothetical protein
MQVHSINLIDYGLRNWPLQCTSGNSQCNNQCRGENGVIACTGDRLLIRRDSTAGVRPSLKTQVYKIIIDVTKQNALICRFHTLNLNTKCIAWASKLKAKSHLVESHTWYSRAAYLLIHILNLLRTL